MDKSYFKTLELMIAGSQIDQLSTTILSAFDDAFLGDIKNTVLLLSSQYTKVVKDQSLDLIDYKEYSLQHSRITNAFIILLGELKNKWLDEQPKVDVIQATPGSIGAPPGKQVAYFERDPDELRGLEWFNKTMQVAQNICQILIQADGCMATGILIEGGWVITNHQVLFSEESAADSIARFFYDGTEEGSSVPLMTVKFSKEGFYTDKELNFTIARLEEDAEMPEINKIQKLKISTENLQTGDFVSVIHHPLGGPKKIDVQARILEITPTRTVYDAVTQPGSDGGAVFNSSNELLGIHTGRNPDNRKYFIPIQLLQDALKEKGITF